ncbi:gephyrin-like molybdotransferase Glp [Poseidonocella sedimentorum]|uniref:Molybdopterin molybdenumtransferase n=1 Tax=Poseidonocella sedimentorum TaxID=871652 RepID=A0A1I6DHJ3_9RHOB|nr:gephyrin-like molybdotransferase Glp [Poseidonocella sedimentorum]SFR04925.1 molybdopterin molybdotransferase [Poseidonocella sedimentorum]
MITVDSALAKLFTLVKPPEKETVSLREAAGRVLMDDAIATRDQPPFPASAMDGYAIAPSDPAPGDSFTIIGEAAAGHAFPGRIQSQEAVRIFTGAPLPEGARRVIIQEDVTREADRITLKKNLDPKAYIRPAGTDFRAGSRLTAPRRLTPQDVALLAAMNLATVPVARRPEVALISTGDELVMPGDTPGPDQIIASNTFGLAAMLDAEGARTRILPIAPDTPEDLAHLLEMAHGADLIVTIGGASVGDHDLVGQVAQDMGLDRAFYKIAMRPGKPLMAGRIGEALMIGLPGNPVSAMVCGTIFLRPLLRAMQGLPAVPMPRRQATLTSPLPPNGPREHYMRAQLLDAGIAAFERQDSALLTVLQQANALLIRPIADPARAAGETVDYIPL